MFGAGALADATGGSVSKVDPLRLTENFTQMLENPVIASNVTGMALIAAGI